MKTNILFILPFFIISFVWAQKNEGIKTFIARGQMPAITMDKKNNLHIVYGSGDSILYVSSKDGKSFSIPSLIAMLPKLFASSMRGPQIAATADGLIVLACTKNGNIYSYKQGTTGKWSQAVKLNEDNETAMEALTGLGADGKNVFAIWLSVEGKGQTVD
jgi:hypothetical protein